MGEAGQEGDQAHDQDGPERIGKAVVQGNGAAYRLQSEKGDAAEGSVCHTEFAPLARAMWRIAQRIVLHGFISDPGVVVAPDAEDALGCAVHALSFWCVPQASIRPLSEAEARIVLQSQLLLRTSNDVWAPCGDIPNLRAVMILLHPTSLPGVLGSHFSFKDRIMKKPSTSTFRPSAADLQRRRILQSLGCHVHGRAAGPGPRR